jgi:hypothetical protein
VNPVHPCLVCLTAWRHGPHSAVPTQQSGVAFLLRKPRTLFAGIMCLSEFYLPPFGLASDKRSPILVILFVFSGVFTLRLAFLLTVEAAGRMTCHDREA